MLLRIDFVYPFVFYLSRCLLLVVGFVCFFDEVNMACSLVHGSAAPVREGRGGRAPAGVSMTRGGLVVLNGVSFPFFFFVFFSSSVLLLFLLFAPPFSGSPLRRCSSAPPSSSRGQGASPARSRRSCYRLARPPCVVSQASAVLGR